MRRRACGDERYIINIDASNIHDNEPATPGQCLQDSEYPQDLTQRDYGPSKGINQKSNRIRASNPGLENSLGKYQDTQKRRHHDHGSSFEEFQNSGESSEDDGLEHENSQSRRNRKLNSQTTPIKEKRPSRQSDKRRSSNIPSHYPPHELYQNYPTHPYFSSPPSISGWYPYCSPSLYPFSQYPFAYRPPSYPVPPGLSRCSQASSTGPIPTLPHKISPDPSLYLYSNPCFSYYPHSPYFPSYYPGPSPLHWSFPLPLNHCFPHVGLTPTQSSHSSTSRQKQASLTSDMPSTTQISPPTSQHNDSRNRHHHKNNTSTHSHNRGHLNPQDSYNLDLSTPSPPHPVSPITPFEFEFPKTLRNLSTAATGLDPITTQPPCLKPLPLQPHPSRAGTSHRRGFSVDSPISSLHRKPLISFSYCYFCSLILNIIFSSHTFFFHCSLF